MPKARIFRSGNGQAVQLPKGFRFRRKEVEIFKRGGEIVLREKSRGLGRVVDIIAELPEDLGDFITPDGRPQKREGFIWNIAPDLADELEKPLPSAYPKRGRKKT